MQAGGVHVTYDVNIPSISGKVLDFERTDSSAMKIQAEETYNNRPIVYQLAAFS